MKNIKQQFAEFRKTTPKHIQWLLLVAAFIVVIILLTLILQQYYGGKSTDKDIVETKPVEWSFEPEQLNFEELNVGDTLQHKVKVIVTDSVYIDNVYVDKDTDNWVITGNCDRIISSSCVANVEYVPTVAMPTTKTSLVIVYHLPDEDDNKQTKKIPVTFSATKVEVPEPVVEQKPEPVSESEPETAQEIEQEPESETEQEPTDIVEEVEVVAPAVAFAEPEPDSRFVLPSEKCSDFAIPGYNQSGVQIGWIKPSSGANYFYPLSDKDCSNPTGKYDWSTGIITSLKDGSKIGTDADHIGYRNVKNRNLTLPNLSNPVGSSAVASNGQFENAVWSKGSMKKMSEEEGWGTQDLAKYLGSAEETESVTSSAPYDRTFILRQFKPIPATIVSEVRADASVYGCATGSATCDPDKNHSIPVRATVDRNVYSDDGRTIIVPTGTLLMGYLDGELPGPYQSFGRMNIKWYQFIRPDGVEFNFDEGQDPYSGDAQGRVGVPGRGSTDYVEQMVMPILTAMVPAAVNLIAPIADTFVNQINLDTNTVVQSGTVRSSEMAKQEIINQWNRITNKLVFDAINNTVPPFSIPAGTRINVYSPVDLIVTCGEDGSKKCAFKQYATDKRRKWNDLKGKVKVNPQDSSWVGQVRSWDLQKYCEEDPKSKTGKQKPTDNWMQSGYDYRTVLMFCESLTYEAKNNVKNEVYSAQQTSKFQEQYGTAENRNEEQTKAYNKDILGLQYADDGETILNPFAKPSSSATPEEAALTCEDGSAPDANGCCTGETYTDMGEQGFNCCPDSGGDCFPPITVE